MRKNMIVEPTIEELKEFNPIIADLIDKDFDSFTFEPLEVETANPNDIAFTIDYINLIKSYKLLTIEEEAQIALQASKGDETARKQLLEANLTLVVLIAEKYQGRGLPMLDLIQEGNIGLIQASEKFDYQMEFRFRIYAAWRIARTITQAIESALLMQNAKNIQPMSLEEAKELLREHIPAITPEGLRKLNMNAQLENED